MCCIRTLHINEFNYFHHSFHKDPTYSDLSKGSKSQPGNPVPSGSAASRRGSSLVAATRGSRSPGSLLAGGVLPNTYWALKNTYIYIYYLHGALKSIVIAYIWP